MPLARPLSRALVAGALLLACARALPPPGGERDGTPPRIVGTAPAERAVITDLDQPVIFRFDERISERGIRDLILVSPATGVPRVDKGRSEIRVEMPDGWKADQVYRVVLLPGLRDLFGNERRDPTSLVFSTGPPVPNTALGGVVIDRITGNPAKQVVIEALRLPDSVTYATVGDTSAFFALTNLPAGDYRVSAYIDQNRNRRRDAAEAVTPRDRLVPLPTGRDTIVLELGVAPADTTPPRLVRAEARDSIEVRLSIDDHLEPTAPLEAVKVALFTLPDTTPVPGSPRVLRADHYDATQRASADSTRVRARPPSLGARTPPGDTVRLPLRELVLVPQAPLTPGAKYLVRIEGLTNVTLISGGGGQAEFQVPMRPEPARRDTTRLGLRRSRSAVKRGDASMRARGRGET